MKIKEHRLIHDAFEVGVTLKGLDGLLEIIGGVLLIFLSPARIHNIIYLLTAHELSEDPGDIVANSLIQFGHTFSVNLQIFSIVFLLSHGIIKIFIVLSLWQKKLWAYPTAIAIFSLFLVYQMYRFSLSFSPFMLLLSVLDVFVIILTWLEYKRIKKS